MSVVEDTPDSSDEASKPLEIGVVVAGFALSGLAILRLLLPHANDRFFDQDPATVDGALPALGPGASLWWDAVLVLVSVGVLWYESRRRGLDGLLVGLAVLPVPVLWWHGWFDAMQAVRGADWLAAAMATTAMAHLARAPGARRLLLSVVFGAVVAMGLRGLYQLEVEHPQTVRFFVENREAFLEAKGWAMDSPEARSFERRLRQPEATGWIGFSNVFSGLSAVVAIGLLASLVGRRRAADDVGTPPAVRLLIGLSGVGLAVLVGLNGSKGAILASTFGVCLAVGLLGRSRGVGGPRRSMWPLVAVAIGGLAVVLRGLLPEDFAADRSLLFRWHYLQGAWSMFTTHPWFGVGPDGFQEAYATMKPARSPETVASAHGLVADWMASLGVLGVAWVVWLVRLFVRPNVEASDGALDDASSMKPLAVGGFIVTLFVLYEQIRTVDVASDAMIVFLVVAVLLGLAAGACVWMQLIRLRGRDVHAIAVVVAAVLLLQGQIEMLFWQPGSLFVCGALLATASTVPIGTASRGRGVTVVSVLAGIVLAAPVFVASLDQAMVDARVRAAIGPLHRSADAPPVTIEMRRTAAESLGLAVSNWRHEAPIRGATEQLLLAGSGRDLDAASALVDEWFALRPGPPSASYRLLVRRSLASSDGGEAAHRSVLPALEDAIRFGPSVPARWLEKAEVLAELGECEAALAALLEAERLDRNLELDPLVRFGDRESTRVEVVRARCAAGGTGRNDLVSE